MIDLDVFIRGEIIDLCIPTIEFSRDSHWYSWFNDPKITKYLEKRVLFHLIANQNKKDLKNHFFYH